MSEELLRDESITTFFAGHETTARTMTFAWYALACNPHVAEKSLARDTELSCLHSSGLPAGANLG